MTCWHKTNTDGETLHLNDAGPVLEVHTKPNEDCWIEGPAVDLTPHDARLLADFLTLWADETEDR